MTSEDTIFFTATVYVKGITDSAQRSVAKKQLAPLVRCPHLSESALMWSALMDDGPNVLLSGLQEQLKTLMMMRSSNHTGSPLTESIKDMLPDAPALLVAAAACHQRCEQRAACVDAGCTEGCFPALCQHTNLCLADFWLGIVTGAGAGWNERCVSTSFCIRLLQLGSSASPV